MQFLSDEWVQAYTQAWNNDELLAKKFKKFSATFKYTVTDRENIEPIVITIMKGKCTHFEKEASFSGKKIEFAVEANAEAWREVFSNNMSVKDIMRGGGFKFQGPKLKALSNKTGLERSVEILLNMENVTV